MQADRLPTSSSPGLSLVLLGAGKMGSALLHGWVQAELAGAGTRVIDPAPAPELAAFCAGAGVALNAAPDRANPPDVLVLAIKPQMLDAVAQTAADLAGPQTLVISILAGKSLADVAARVPRARALVRVMPNTPAAVGRGVSGLCANDAVSEDQRALAGRLLGAVGEAVWLEREDQMDAVTAVSGSGPAYVFLLAECLAQAGVAAGLAPETAARLARATVEGAGELMFRSPEISPEQLRINVTSPGGTTAAALAELMSADGLAPLMERAVAAAQRRGRELAG